MEGDFSVRLSLFSLSVLKIGQPGERDLKWHREHGTVNVTSQANTGTKGTLTQGGDRCLTWIRVCLSAFGRFLAWRSASSHSFLTYRQPEIRIKKAFDFTDKRHLKYKFILFPLLSGAEFPQIAFITAKSFVFKCFKLQRMANGRLISMRTTLKGFFKAGQNTSSPSPCDCGAWSPAAPWPSGSDCAPCRRRGSRSKCQHRRWAGESARWLPIFEHIWWVMSAKNNRNSKAEHSLLH